MPQSVERLARSAVLNPIYISVGEVGDLAQSVSQNVIFMHSYQKRVISFAPVTIVAKAFGSVKKYS